MRRLVNPASMAPPRGIPTAKQYVLERGHGNTDSLNQCPSPLYCGSILSCTPKYSSSIVTAKCQQRHPTSGGHRRQQCMCSDRCTYACMHGPVVLCFAPSTRIVGPPWAGRAFMCRPAALALLSSPSSQATYARARSRRLMGIRRRSIDVPERPTCMVTPRCAGGRPDGRTAALRDHTASGLLDRRAGFPQHTVVYTSCYVSSLDRRARRTESKRAGRPAARAQGRGTWTSIHACHACAAALATSGPARIIGVLRSLIVGVSASSLSHGS